MKVAQLTIPAIQLPKEDSRLRKEANFHQFFSRVMLNKVIDFAEGLLEATIAVESNTLNQPSAVVAFSSKQASSLGLFGKQFGGFRLRLDGGDGHCSLTS
jgi:hypothetical protein